MDQIGPYRSKWIELTEQAKLVRSRTNGPIGSHRPNWTKLDLSRPNGPN